jgi:hypothetical protein
MTQTLLSQNNRVEAEKYLGRLKAVNSKNQYVPELESRIAQIKGIASASPVAAAPQNQ